jgi:hypothetical protein
MRKLWIAAFVCIALVASPLAHADEASKEAKVRELFTAMRMEHTMEQMMGMMQQQVQQMARNAPVSDTMTPPQKKLTDEYLAGTMKLATESMGWKAIEPEYVKLYATTYTEQEIDGILTFYRSPAGQAMLAKAPELSSGAIKIVQAKMADLQPKMKSMQDDYTKKMLETLPPNTPTKKN